MNVWKFYGQKLFFSCFFLISACAAQDTCRPGNYDGAWVSVGASPPAISRIKGELVGMTPQEAAIFLGKTSLELKGQLQKEETKKYWLFERMKKLQSLDCTSEGVTQYRQDILWIEAVIKDGRIQSCAIGIKGAISRKIRASNDIFADKKGPLDEDLGLCSR